MKFRFTLLVLLLFAFQSGSAQSPVFTFEDTLRGSITPQRAWWDLLHYHLDIEVLPESREIRGRNTITFRVLEDGDSLQLDLQAPMKLERVTLSGQSLPFSPKGRNAFFISIPGNHRPGDTIQLIAEYSGKPREARNAPWDGGLSWKKDKSGNHFIATSCQGLGASVWWPCKDHMYDEPDSMRLSVTVPKPLIGVGNGRLVKTTDLGDRQTFVWVVRNPINNYGVNVNIAPYATFTDQYIGEKGALDLSYYVLPANLDKAKRQFAQVKDMLKAFEFWLGPYPFYEDGFKIVEVPYLGMEHQSSITYGNQYRNGYLGGDLSGSGWGMKWDYIIIHESGHEWFANNITYRDIADMWVHESFTTYAECLYTEFHFGKKAGAEYVIGQRRSVVNEAPIIGLYDVNYEGSGDMYFKGANMLHTLRQWVNDDEKWRSILRSLNRDFYHQTVTGAQIEQYIAEKTGLPLQPFFDQYLRTTQIPAFEYEVRGKSLQYRWTSVVNEFNMPLRIRRPGGEWQWIYPTTSWQKMKWKKKGVEVDENWYVGF